MQIEPKKAIIYTSTPKT